MDSIRKKMHSLRTEIAEYNNRTSQSEEKTRNYISSADQYDIDIKDVGKRINAFEDEYDSTSNNLLASESKLSELEKELSKHEEEICALNRRQQLLEGDNKQSDEKLASTVLQLGNTSKNADTILKQVKVAENRNMNNEATIEGLDKNLKEANKMKRDSEYKLEELTRRLGVLEDELRKTEERANTADQRVLDLEDELRMIGENMKQLEVSEEKALKREEVYKEKINVIANKLKMTENRTEYGEKSIRKLNHRIDEIEDDIIRQKQKTMKISDELDETFDNMFD